MRKLSARSAKLLLALVLAVFGAVGVTSAASAAAPDSHSTQNAPASHQTKAISPAQASCGDTSGYTVVELSSLPSQATDTVKLIQAGGPYPYPEDGTVFDNREGVLPNCSSGYYHEYTVTTPGSSTRGTRRIVTGSGGEFFYTGDHYATFQLIDPKSLPGGGGGGGGGGGIATVGLSTLPSAVVDAVHRAQSGATSDGEYQNREGVIPAEPSGYYQIYKAAGSDTERVIAGSGGELYYTPDRYSTFDKIDVNS
ncbi:MAG: ribonuclease [Sciscionella sp.]|nr:ribonuclease [Sciscionella sp.]